MDLKTLLEYKLFTIGKNSIEVSTILFLILFIAGLYVLLFLVRKLIYKSKKLDASKKFTIYALIKYAIYVLGFVLGLDIIGLNVSVFMAGSAALLVGIGLGLQNLFSDFVSGIILLMDSAIKVGDVIEVDGLVCRVQEINLRTTTVLTRDDKYIILPNTILTKNHLINWTHSETTSRFEVNLGIAYGSNVQKAMDILQNAASMHPKVEATPLPFVRFKDYGDSALVFEVVFWTKEVFRVENIKSDMRVQFFKAFAENNIEIPFPQRVVHIKNPANA